jgi:hypothetical protein
LVHPNGALYLLHFTSRAQAREVQLGLNVLPAKHLALTATFARLRTECEMQVIQRDYDELK